MPAGYFKTAGGVTADYIAKWDGSSWSPLGAGMNWSVLALTVFDDGSGEGPALYAGGHFTNAGGVSANRIAKWDGSTWSPLASGMSHVALALTVFDDGTGGGSALYAGGAFDTAGGVTVNRIAKWDGLSWSPLTTGTDSTVRSLAAFDGGLDGNPALFAGGSFATAGGITVDGIANWDGSSWSPRGIGLNSVVRALAVCDDGFGAGPVLYAGGDFITAGGVSANHIAQWDGSSWSPLGQGLNSNVYALTTYDDGPGGGPALYASGTFTAAGGVSANRIAKWDGSSWSPLGAGLNKPASALAVFDDGLGGGPALYVGGSFTTEGGWSQTASRSGMAPRGRHWGPVRTAGFLP